MKKPKVFIIILNWNGLEDTLECINSLQKSSYPNFEIVTVDNGSDNNQAEIISSRCPQVKVIKNEANLGFTEGNNVGIKYAMANHADYIWLLNNDTVTEKQCLEELTKEAELDSKTGLLSPVIYHYDKPSTIQFCGGYCDKDSFALANAKDFEEWKAISRMKKPIILWGTALFVKRKVIDQIGGLDPGYFAYYEDCDYSLRAIRAGFSNKITEAARIYHKDSRSTGSRLAPLQVFLRIRNVYFFWMNHLQSKRAKKSYLKEYLAHVITFAGSLEKEGLRDAARACLSGAWCALLGIGGPWPKEKEPPWPVRQIIKWHPNFWAGLIKGDYSGVMTEMRKRLGDKGNRGCMQSYS